MAITTNLQASPEFVKNDLGLGQPKTGTPSEAFVRDDLGLPKTPQNTDATTRTPIKPLGGQNTAGQPSAEFVRDDLGLSQAPTTTPAQPAQPTQPIQEPSQFVKDDLSLNQPKTGIPSESFVRDDLGLEQKPKTLSMSEQRLLHDQVKTREKSGMSKQQIMDNINSNPRLKSLVEATQQARTTTAQQQQQAGIQNADNTQVQANSNFTALQTNQPTLPNKGLADANIRYGDFAQYSAMSPQQLATSIGSGALLVGSKTWNDLLQNGQTDKLAQAQTYANMDQRQKVNNYMLDSTAIDTNKDLKKQTKEPLQATDYIGQLNQKYVELLASPDRALQLKDFLATKPDVIQAKEKLTQLQSEAQGVNNDLKNLYDDVVTQFAGTGATDGFVRAYVAEKQKPLLKKLDSLNLSLSTQTAVLSNLTDTYKAELDTTQAQTQQQMEGVQYLIGQENAKIQQEQQAKMEEQKFKQEVMLKQMGFDQETAKQLSSQEFEMNMLGKKQQFDVGMENLQTQNEIKRDDYKGQREYQIALLKKGVNPDPSTPADYTQNVQTAVNNLLSSPDLAKGNTGGRCGEFVNNYAQSVLGNKVALNTIGEKKALANSAGPVNGGIVIMKSPTYPENGHIGITLQDENGNRFIKDSNGKGDKKIDVRALDINSKEILGFGDLTKPSTGNPNIGKPTKNLSSLAKIAIKSKTLPGTSTQKAKVAAELEEAGEFDKGEGNYNLYNAPAQVKTEAPSFLNMNDSREKAYKLYKENKSEIESSNIGPYDRLKTKAWGVINKQDPAYVEINRILQTQLSQYANKISGATVSESEMKRLREQIPNMDMGNEQQFEKAMDAYNDIMATAKSGFNTQRGFSDINKAKKVLLGQTTEPTTETGTATDEFTSSGY